MPVLCGFKVAQLSYDVEHRRMVINGDENDKGDVFSHANGSRLLWNAFQGQGFSKSIQSRHGQTFTSIGKC